MLFEMIILFEIVAFLFLIMGLIPYSNNEGRKNPYLNKIIFVLVSGIMFFALGIWTVNYDYNYCYINETVTDFTLNSTISTATCASYMINTLDVSYLNYGMGLVCSVIFFVLILFASLSRHDDIPDDDSGL